MYNFNSAYLTKKVRSYVSDLINDYGYETFSQLTHADQCEFAGILIEASGKNNENDFLLQSSNLDQIVGSFRRSLCNGSDDDFMIAMQDNAIDYFHETMMGIFNHIQYEQWADSEWMSHISRNSEHHCGDRA